MKRKESGSELNAEERAKMAIADAFVPYPDGSPKRRLYNKFVREFVNSTKIARAARTGATWHTDKKLKHVWKRYCGDAAYAELSDRDKRKVMALALDHAVDVQEYTLEDIEEATSQDYAARETASLQKKVGPPGTAEKLGVALLEAAANKGTGGVYALVKVSAALRDGAHRREVADRYSGRFATMSASDDLSLASVSDLDDDGLLGVAAAFLAMKLERFESRQIRVVAAQSLSVAGTAINLVPVVGQGVSTVLSAASTAVSATVTLEQVYNNLCKRIANNLGIARETIALSLWGLGRRSHKPTLEFLTELGLIDGPEGVLVNQGFFDRNNMRLATNFISVELKSTARS